MDKPRSISSGEAMRWNEDVNRRRLEHHKMRCAEDSMYRSCCVWYKDWKREDAYREKMLQRNRQEHE